MSSKSEDVLKALSSSTRRTIMRQISEKGSATYTEIMHVLNLDPNLMSGKFNYHLKELNEAGLIERTNGEYRITDMGKKALILVDQVAKESKVDKYGVLSAVMSMSPRKELELFMSQMGMMTGFVFFLISLIPIIIRHVIVSSYLVLSYVVLPVSLLVALLSTVKMVGIIRRFRVGFSSILFLSSNWFFIRSPNRNSFFVITMFLVGAIVACILGIVLPYTGEIQLFSLQWYGLITSSFGSAILASVFSIRAKRKADRLEEMKGEQ